MLARTPCRRSSRLRPCGVYWHQRRGVGPCPRHKFDRVQTDAHDEVGPGEKRLLHRRTGEQPGVGRTRCWDGSISSAGIAPADLVEPLVCHPVRAVSPDHIADQQMRKREAVQRGLGQAIARTGEAGPAGHHRHAGRPRHLTVGRGHHAVGRFPVGKHERQAEFLAGGDHVQVRAAARHAEAPADPSGLRPLASERVQ